MASIIRHRGGWRALIRRAGHPSQSKTFSSKQDAQRWARDREAAIDRGERVHPGLRVTFGELVAAYNAVARAGRSKAQALEAIEKALGSYRLAELHPQTFLQYAAKRRRAGAGPTTILMDLSYVGTVLRHAGVLLDAATPSKIALEALSAARSTLRHSGSVKGSNERQRRPEPTEMASLHAYWQQHPPRLLPMWEIVCFAIATTMRLSEITRLRADDYDPQTRTIVIRNRKHPTEKVGNDQRVPLLTGHATILNKVLDPNEIVAHRIKSGSRFVLFPYAASSVSNMFTRAVTSCGIDDLHFHDLRHDAVSRMFEYGYRIEEVALCSGHRSWNMLRRYTNIRPESLHR